MMARCLNRKRIEQMPVATLTDVEAFAVKATDKIFPGYKLMVEELNVRFRLVITSSYESRSVYGFVDKTTGNAYKAASWKAPAKGVRGNIFDDSGVACCQLFSIL
jgi:hypothetical protein